MKTHDDVKISNKNLYTEIHNLSFSSSFLLGNDFNGVICVLALDHNENIWSFRHYCFELCSFYFFFIAFHLMSHIVFGFVEKMKIIRGFSEETLCALRITTKVKLLEQTKIFTLSYCRHDLTRGFDTHKIIS